MYEKHIRTYVISNSVNCIFFSNEMVPLLVERSDRRFNVVETGGPLTSCAWFNAEKVLPKLSKELPMFAQYLWNIDIDISKANTAIANDVKDSLISASMNRFEEFATRLKNADIDWLIENINEELNIFHPITSNELESLKENKITKKLALEVFNWIYPENKATVKSLTTKMRLYGIKDDRDNDGVRSRIYKW
jgi:hypothetical protein